MDFAAERGKERRVIVGVVALSLGCEAHAFSEVVLSSKVEALVAPMAQPEQRPPVVDPPCALLQVVDVQAVP